MHVTFYGGLYNPVPLGVEDLTWPEFMTRLGTSREAKDKFSVPGFGAHTLLPGKSRAADWVTAVTALVFDVDAGTPEQVAASLSSLTESGLSFFAYTSHSHTAPKPAWRFVIPVTRPMTTAEYPGLRRAVIQRFAIPCKPNQSGDASRFWFSPSHPPGGNPESRCFAGAPLDVDAITPLAPDLPPLSAPSREVPLSAVPMPEEIHAELLRIAKRKPHRAEAIYRLVEGRPLADAGARNDTALRVCGILAFAFPDVPIPSLLDLMRPSLTAMQAAGSKLTEAKLERMLVTAREKRRKTAEDLEELRRQNIQAVHEILTRIGAKK